MSEAKAQLFCVIAAGGAGSRLNPLSKGKTPKQFFKFNGGLSLFQRMFINLADFADDRNIISAVNIEHIETASAQLKELQEKFCRALPYKTVTEPAFKNTAPALALALKYINTNLKYFYDEIPIILFAPSDKIFLDREILSEMFEKGIEYAQNGFIACFGAPAETLNSAGGCFKTKKNSASENTLKISEYIQELDEPAENIEKLKLYENTGIYMFSLETFMNELKKYEKDIYTLISEISSKTAPEQPVFNAPYDKYEKMPDISIEDALISKTKKLVLIPLETKWKDIDSWDDVYEISEKDENGNCLTGKVTAADCTDSLVYSAGRLTAVLGVKDMVIAASDKSSFIYKRNNPESLKKIYAKIQNKTSLEERSGKTFSRKWGSCTILEGGEGFLTKIITVNPKTRLSLNQSSMQNRSWLVLNGEAAIIKDEGAVLLKEGESININTSEPCSLQNYGAAPLQLFEVQTGGASEISEELEEDTGYLNTI